MDHSTLSLQGVTRLLNKKEAEFTELNQWIQNYKHFQELIKIKTFAKFRMWKAFSVWRRNVRWRYTCKLIVYCITGKFGKLVSLQKITKV